MILNYKGCVTGKPELEINKNMIYVTYKGKRFFVANFYNKNHSIAFFLIKDER